MKKYALSLLSVFFLFSAACSPMQSDDPSLSSTIPATTAVTSAAAASTAAVDTDPIYTVYSNYLTYDSGREDVVYLYDESMEFTYFSTTAADAPEETQKTFSINGKTYTLPYHATYRNVLADSNDESLRELGLWDEYLLKTSSGNIRAAFSRDTARLISFRDNTAKATTGTFTDEEAIAQAEALFAALYGEDFASQYPQGYIVGTSQEENVCVYFDRQICGYATQDWVSFTFNPNGTICSIYAQRLGYLEDASSTITAEMIESAKTAFFSTASEEWDLREERIVLGSDGNYYLYVSAFITSGEYPVSLEFYISIIPVAN